MAASPGSARSNFLRDVEVPSGKDGGGWLGGLITINLPIFLSAHLYLGVGQFLPSHRGSIITQP